MNDDVADGWKVAPVAVTRIKLRLPKTEMLLRVALLQLSAYSAQQCRESQPYRPMLALLAPEKVLG